MKKVTFVSSESIENSFPEKFSIASNEFGKILIASYVHSLQSDHKTTQEQIHSNIEQEFQDIQNTSELYAFQSKVLQKTSFEIWSVNQKLHSFIRMSICIYVVTPEMVYFASVGTLRSYLIRNTETLQILQSKNISAIPIGSEPFCSPTIEMIPLFASDSILIRSSNLQSLISDDELLIHYKKSMNLLPSSTNALESLQYTIKQHSFDAKVVIEPYQILLFEITDEEILVHNDDFSIPKQPVFKPLISAMLMITLLLTTTCFLLFKEVKKLHRTTEILLERNEEILINTSTKYMPQIEQLLQSNNERMVVDSTKVVTELQLKNTEKK